MIDVGTTGQAIDITVSEFKFDGETLSTGLESMEWTCNQDEEVTHFQGKQDPQERNRGQRTYEASGVIGARQWVLLCERFGGWSNLKNKEFTLVVNAIPENDPNLYSFTFKRFRFLKDSINADKSSGKNKFSASFLGYDQKSVVRGT